MPKLGTDVFADFICTHTHNATMDLLITTKSSGNVT